MADQTANDNQRKDVDRWDDEGGRPRSPERSPRPNPVESLPSPPDRRSCARTTLPSDPKAAQAILLEHTTERAVAKDVSPGHPHSRGLRA